jgi:DNA-binding CsgD family transcriptional regulator/tetratricopeptide (TPR) repeat protein
MPSPTSWPFVGRDEELEWIAAARRDDSCCGVVVSGPAGVGKTRLAREVLAAAAADGAATEWVQATQAAASIPLGALAGLIPAGVRADDRLRIFQLCAQGLVDRAGTSGVVLGVDDAQLLDAASAALVLHLATSGTFVVVTVRAGEQCPDSIVALWKDLETPRLELQQLSEDETAELLEAALGGEPAPGMVHWAFVASEGHVLYLRELVKGALADGALQRNNGQWELRSRPAASPALVELISAALDGLSAEELDAARVLALGEPLDVETVTSIVGVNPLSGLEEKGLAHVDTSEERSEVRLDHPLYGEVVRQTMPSLRGLELRRRLAATVRARGLTRPGEALRAAIWLDDAGDELDEPLLLAAARDANASGDPALAEHFARRAPPAPEQALLLGSSYALRRRFDEAEEVLAGVEGALPTRELALAYLDSRAMLVLHLGLSRDGDALDLLGRAEEWFPDAAWRDQVDMLRTEMVWQKSPAEALDVAERLLQHDDVRPEVRRRTLITHVAMLHREGRNAEAYALSAPMRPSLPRDEVEMSELTTWLAVRFASGYDWDEVERWLIEAGKATEGGFVLGEIQVNLAAVALGRGKPATAVRSAREAIEIFERADPFRRLPLGWLYVVMGSAMRRDADEGRAALETYEAALADAPVPLFWRHEATARGMLLAAEGETGRAAATLFEAVEAGEGRPLDQTLLLHQAFRAGAPPETVASALERAAAGCDAPLASALARLVAGAAAGDGRSLTESADALAEIGGRLWAAEAAALGAGAFHREGREDSARRAMAQSDRFLGECEDVWSPLLAAVAMAPAELTGREREIVALAARGASNAEIAERLELSVRTVESHLYRAMRKLGASTRQELSLD